MDRNFTLCTNKSCQLRQDCYRYRAFPKSYSMKQPYLKFQPNKRKSKNEGFACNYFLKIPENDITIKLKKVFDVDMEIPDEPKKKRGRPRKVV